MPKPIFERKPVTLRIPRLMSLVSGKSFLPSLRKTIPSIQSDPCWIGACPKCGRTLISAVDGLTVRTDHYECGICE